MALNLQIAVVAVLAFVLGGAVMWMWSTIQSAKQAQRDLAARLTAAEEALQKIGTSRRAWTDELKLDHRAQLLSIAALVKLAARDNLDALIRVSPGLAEEVLNELKLKH